MNERRYDNQVLNEYLLGSLPDAEAERFDEMSFTDEDFADALHAAEKDLVDAFIQDELNGATLEKFKTHYLASPLRREKVEFAKAFQVYAEQQKTQSPATAETKPKRTIAGFFSNIFTIPRSAGQWSFAFAALAFIFFGVWLFRENSRLRVEMNQTNANREQLLQREAELAGREKQMQDEADNQRSANSATEKELAQISEERIQLEQQLKKQTQEQEEERQRLAKQRKSGEQPPRAAQTAPSNFPNPVAIASFILAPSLRGGSKIQSVSIPASTTKVAVSLELETGEYAVYRAVLRSQSDNRILWQSGKLKSKIVGGNTRLHVGFPAGLLKSEVYSIEVSGIAADGEAEIISDYSFRVMR